MKNIQYSIQASTVEANEHGLLKYLQAEGKLQCLLEIQESIHELERDDQARVPFALVSDNVKTIADITQDENLGLKIINIIELDKIPLYATIKHSVTIIFHNNRSGPLPILLSLITRYFAVITEVTSVSVSEYREHLSINLTPNLPDIVSKHQIEGVVVGIFRMLKQCYPIKLLDVELRHSQPENTDTLYQNSLGLVPKFDCEQDRILISTKNTTGEVEATAVSLFSAVQHLMDAQFPDISFKGRCQHILKCILSFGEPKREHIAKILNLSISSLQRRLKQEGYTYQQLLLLTRKELAFEFLVEQKRSATDVAFLLGYQSTSQFFKAFKKWFKVTLVQYQKARGNVS